VHIVQVIGYGLRLLGDAIGSLGAKIGLGGAGDWFKDLWDETVHHAQNNDYLPEQKPSTGTAGTPGAPGASGASTAKDLMANLVARGFTVPEAAAIVSNAEAESGLKSNNPNSAGGGNGAHGLFQLRGARLAAFQQKYGISPDQATPDQQFDFMSQDPYERSLLKQSLSGPGGAAELGARFNDTFEANGVIGEGARRGARAQQLASAYGGTTGGGVGQQINIQSVNVQANTPQEFVGGITRQSNVQSYNSAVR
jgi:hypothetical protein